MSPHRDRTRRALRATGVVTLAGLVVWVVSRLTAPGDAAGSGELSPLSPTGPEVALGLAATAWGLTCVFVTLWLVLWVAERLGSDLATRRARR